MLLYEYCIDNDNLVLEDERLYDRIIFKFIIYSISNDSIFEMVDSNETADDNNIASSSLLDNFKQNQSSSLQNFIDEIVDLIRNELFVSNANTKEKSSMGSIDKLSSYSLASLTTTSMGSASDSMKENNELSEATTEFLKELLIKNHLKVKKLFELIIKYNQKSDHVLLNVHVSALNKIIHNLQENLFTTLFNLLNLLNIYNLEAVPYNDSKIQNIRSLFSSLCSKLNDLYGEDLDKMDQIYLEIYSCFLSKLNEEENSLTELLFRAQYEIDNKLLIQSTFNDLDLPILSMIKKYFVLKKNENFLWRMFYLHCYVEKKLLIKSLIVIILIIKKGNLFY